MKLRITVFMAASALILFMLPFTCKATRFIFGTDKPMIDGAGNASAVRPGDTIYLSASTRLYVLLRRLHGTAENPILVQNLGGQVVFSNNSTISFSLTLYVITPYQTINLKPHTLHQVFHIVLQSC